MREEVCTTFTDPSGDRGYIVQAWDPDTATYELVDALLTDERWVPARVELVAGKGIPAFTYFTLRQMKLFGIAEGGIRRLIIHANYHLESILQLARGENSGVSVAEAVLRTRAYQSVETPLVQSFHRVVSQDLRGGTRGQIADVLAWHATGGAPLRREIGRDRRGEHARLLEEFEVTPADTVLYGYEVHLVLMSAKPEAGRPAQ